MDKIEKTILDFDKVFLDARSLQILDKISSGTILTLDEYSAKWLLDYGFISKYAFSISGAEYVVTNLGRFYNNYLGSKNEVEKKKESREQFQTWFALILSNLIALAALIVSILK